MRILTWKGAFSTLPYFEQSCETTQTSILQAVPQSEAIRRVGASGI